MGNPRESYTKPRKSLINPRTSFVVPRPASLAPLARPPRERLGGAVRGAPAPRQATRGARALVPRCSPSFPAPSGGELLGTAKEVLGTTKEVLGTRKY